MHSKHFISGILAVILLTGCASQVISEHLLKGSLVKEVGSGKFAEGPRKRSVELVSPLSVRVHDRIERTEATTRYYRKLLVRQKAVPRDYPYFDAFLKVLASTAVIPVFTYDYWVQGSYFGTNCAEEAGKCVVYEDSSVIYQDYITEEGTRVTYDPDGNPGATRTVSLFINGYYKGQLPVSADGVAEADLLQFPELSRTEKDVKLTFKYADAYAYSLLGKAEVRKIFQDRDSERGPVPSP